MAKVKNRRDNHALKRPKSSAGYKVYEETINKIYKEMNIDKNVRAEQLNLDDYLKMYRVIYER